MQGKFICLEGAEATGKSTQIKLLEKVFLKNFLRYITTYEPGGNKEAIAIRNLIFGYDFDNITDLLLFFASRHENILKVIKPAIEDNINIICDRFILSSMVYQGYAQNIDIDLILKLHKEVNFNLFPDLTIIIDSSIENIAKRIKERGIQNKIDSKPLTFHKSILKGFKEAKSFYPNKLVIINGDSSKEEVHKDIIKEINNYFNINLEAVL